MHIEGYMVVVVVVLKFEVYLGFVSLWCAGRKTMTTRRICPSVCIS